MAICFQLAKKMSGMFHTLKDALPTFEESQMTLSLPTNSETSETGNSISRNFLFPGNLTGFKNTLQLINLYSMLGINSDYETNTEHGAISLAPDIQ